MKKKRRKQPRHRLLKASCVGAGLLSISNPTQITAADIGLYDVHNAQSLGSIPNPFPDSPLGVHVAVGDLDGDGSATSSWALAVAPRSSRGALADKSSARR